MYDLFIGNKNYSSWSLRPWVLMRELNIPFRENLVPFGGAQNPHAFRDFSPTGKVPCLVDGAITVWDSLAITEYVGERHAGVWPAEAVARAWARSASAEMHSGFFGLRNTCTMNCGLRITLKSIDAPLQRDLARLEELWAEGLIDSAVRSSPARASARWMRSSRPWRFASRPMTRRSAAAPGVTPRSCWRWPR